MFHQKLCADCFLMECQMIGNLKLQMKFFQYGLFNFHPETWGRYLNWTKPALQNSLKPACLVKEVLGRQYVFSMGTFFLFKKIGIIRWVNTSPMFFLGEVWHGDVGVVQELQWPQTIILVTLFCITTDTTQYFPTIWRELGYICFYYIYSCYLCKNIYLLHINISQPILLNIDFNNNAMELFAHWLQRFVMQFVNVGVNWHTKTST